MQAVLSSLDVKQSSPQAEYVQRILNQLSIHVSQQLPSPIYWRIQSNVHCISTLLPGHLERMSKLRECLSSQFGDQFQIVVLVSEEWVSGTASKAVELPPWLSQNLRCVCDIGASVSYSISSSGD
jgi:hypothetical protein